jgi:hypothetical protein
MQENTERKIIKEPILVTEEEEYDPKYDPNNEEDEEI